MLPSVTNLILQFQLLRWWAQPNPSSYVSYNYYTSVKPLYIITVIYFTHIGQYIGIARL